MKIWFFFITLLLPSFWTFGKEKSKDEVEKEKNETKIDYTFLSFLLNEKNSEEFHIPTPEECNSLKELPTGGFILLPPEEINPLCHFLNKDNQSNNAIDNMFLINQLNQLGILERMETSENALCVRDNNEK